MPECELQEDCSSSRKQAGKWPGQDVVGPPTSCAMDNAAPQPIPEEIHGVEDESTTGEIEEKGIE